MGSYKTPGVYVEEISLLPPSVAQVETAIPAFIGYTQMAKEYANDDLLNVPKKIGSMLEYVQYYGGAPSVNITEVNLDSLNQVTSVKLDDNYYLYEAMRMFFSNGGGYCYIVSVGKYVDTIQNGDGITSGFLKGLAAVKKVDEPTLLLAPDASLMSQSNMNTLHTTMLDQCAELQDRFSIFDVRNISALEDHSDVVESFRDGIGINNLKYGAVYSPWLKSNLPRDVKYKDFSADLFQNGTATTLFNILNSSSSTTNATKALVTRLDRLTADQGTVTTGVNLLKASYTSVQSRYDGLLTIIKNTSATPVGTIRGKLTDLTALFVEANDFINAAVNTPTLTDINGTVYTINITDSLVSHLQTKIGTTITAARATLSRFVADATDATNGAGATIPALVGYPAAAGVQTYFVGAATAGQKILDAVSDYNTIWSVISSMLELIISATNEFAANIEKSATESVPLLKTISREISNKYITLPPSSTIAGIYARVDSDRGVWKAPANVSINNVVGVTELIDNKEQASLNVDVVAGKSVNVIRPFTGKGILVWGARTLAGNDNEWRYVPVRRFYIMAEESIRKATEQFVFEPNDANTWVRIRAMIENFLVQQWKAGALAGAKPEQAFYVRVGLGETMTAQDILEGRMNIEIGMAVVRPAEFIILKFSHKMQEA